VRHAEGSPNLPVYMPPGDHGVLDSLRRRGTSRHSRTARPCGGGVPSLLVSRPTLTHSHCLTHPRRNRRWTRGAASHAASRGAVTFVAPPSGGLALPRRRQRRCGCGSQPAFSRKGEGYRKPGASKEAQGKRGPTRRHGLFTNTRALTSMASEDRTLEVVLARHWCCCRSRQTVFWRRQANASPFHPIWKRAWTGA
jgi:hypothetical protein